MENICIYTLNNIPVPQSPNKPVTAPGIDYYAFGNNRKDFLLLHLLLLTTDKKYKELTWKKKFFIWVSTREDYTQLSVMLQYNYCHDKFIDNNINIVISIAVLTFLLWWSYEYFTLMFSLRIEIIENNRLILKNNGLEFWE